MATHPHFPAVDFAERPFILFWEVTRACALACRHCRAIAQPQAHPDELTHEEAMALVDKIADLAPPMLVLTGGDPMMRRDIFDIITRATKVQSGDIILFHNDSQFILEALPEVLRFYKKSGYNVVPVSEILLTGETQIDVQGRQRPLSTKIPEV